MELALNPKNLGDPLVAKWALRQVRYARETGDDDRVKKLEALFDELTLRRIIESGDGDLLPDVFMHLGTSVFSPVEKLLLKSWPSWKSVVACWSAQKIAELAPRDFRLVIAEFVESPDVVRDRNRLHGVLKAVTAVGDAAADIARALVNRVESEGGRDTWWYMLSEMVVASASTCIDEAVSLLARAFREAEEESERRSLEVSLSGAYGALTSDLPYFRQILDVSGKETRQGLADLPALFEAGAPLKTIDKAVGKKGRKRLAAALRLLPDGRDVAPVVGFARRLSGAMPEHMDREDHEILGCFLLAATAAQHARGAYQFDGLSLSAILSAASYDIADLPCYREILDILGRMDPKEVVPGVKAALEKARDHYGGAHLAKMMGDLGYREFIDPLIGCMNRAAGDFISEEAMRALAKIGTEAEEAVMSRWESLDFSQRIYGYGVIKRIGNRGRAVSFLLDRFSEMRSRPADLEGWCVTAQAIPDRRLVEILEGELHRKLVAVDESYATLCSLLELKRPGLEEVRRRVREHRARVGFKSLDEMTVEDVMDDTSHMELLCESCGDTNNFDVPVILISPEHPEEEPCLGGDLACPSCGALGPFKPTAMGMAALIAETVKIKVAADSGVEYSGPLQLATSRLHDGRVVAPSTALNEYRRRVERNPDSIPDLIGLGNIYVHNQSWRLAAGCFEKCLEIGPTCVEAAQSLARIRLEGGDPREAFRLLSNAWRFRDRWRFHRLRGYSPEDFTEAFVDMYNTVARQLRKPMLSGTGVKPSTTGRRKVGRNDPCPCGSGRKYKKCCGPRSA